MPGRVGPKSSRRPSSEATSIRPRPSASNLPNSNWVRAEYGSKSVTIGNLTDAYNKAAHGNGFLQEFVIDDETLQLLDRYQDTCDDLHTDLHECLGHGIREQSML